MDSPRIGDKSVLRGTVIVRMRGDIGKAASDQITDTAHFIVGKGGVKPCHHHLRIALAKADPRLLKLPGQQLISQKKHSFSGKIPFQIFNGGLPRGHDPALIHTKPHAVQLLHVILRSLGGIIGEKDILLSGLLHRRQKIQRSLDPFLSQIDRPIHIQGKAGDSL